MDSTAVISHQRDNALQGNFLLASGQQSSYPRSFQSFDLNSPLPAGAFALWPPTPRTTGERPATVHETTFGPYPMPNYPTSTSGAEWGSMYADMSLSAMSTGVASSGLYDTAGASNQWDASRPRGDFTSLLSNIDTDVDRLGTSASSNEDNYLDANYQPNRISMDSDTLSTLSRRLSDASNLNHHSGSDYEDMTPYDGSSMGGYTRRTTPMAMSAATTPLSPISSPRQSQRMFSHSPSQRKASPSPRPTARSAPYTTESSRNKRWSTGSFYNQQAAPSQYLPQQETLNVQQPIHSHHSSPCSSHAHPHPHPHELTNPYAATQYLLSQGAYGQDHGAFVPSSFMEPLAGQPMGHNIMRMLQSNAEPHHAHYADLSDPPDLYASLQETPLEPPPEDMDPEDPEAKPHEQPGRFEGDLYTPKWVRYHGNRREGWCGICKPGRWLVLKNSAFWYDKSFTHGISAATGQQFVEPQKVRRMDGSPDVWEGLCHSCQDWLPLVSNKKKGTAWFRHAYKCHTHPKIKDAPKRRRESSQSKAAALAAAAAASKQKQQQAAAAAAAAAAAHEDPLATLNRPMTDADFHLSIKPEDLKREQYYN